MKKYIAIVLALVMALGLCACGGDGGEATTPTTGTTQKSTTPIGYTFEYEGVEFGVGMEADGVIDALGQCEPYVTESCGDMGGNDYEYEYLDVTIYANDGEGYVRIYCLLIDSDQVTTPEGVRVSDTAEAVKEVYGEPSSETASALIYEKDGMELQFFLNDSGAVEEIQYLEK